MNSSIDNHTVIAISYQKKILFGFKLIIEKFKVVEL
jgi:hypothetical protein